MISRTALAFVAASGFAAACNFGARIVFSLVMPYVPAVVLAFCVGLLTAFWLNRRFVFASGAPVAREFATFFAVNILALLQTLLVALLLRHYLLPALGWRWQADAIAHAAGIVAPIITSYFAHKHFTFRQRPARPAATSEP